MKDIRLTDTILRKKFNTKALGYCAEEVDAFLDEINEEVLKLEREIEALQEKMRQLEGKNSVLDQQYRN